MSRQVVTQWRLKARLRKGSGLCFASTGSEVVLDLKAAASKPLYLPLWAWRQAGRSRYLDFLGGFCLAGFRGTVARAFMTSLEGLRFRSAVGSVLPPAGTFFFGVRFLTVRFLALDGAFFRDFIVALIPAWAIDRAS